MCWNKTYRPPPQLWYVALTSLLCRSVKVCSLSVVCVFVYVFTCKPLLVCVLEGHSLQTDESAAFLESLTALRHHRAERSSC